MFSANENILLRQHKRRVIEYIEATIPENALELGTSVMAMQVSCRQPGCVPLETAITIVFPKPPKKKAKRNKKTSDAVAAATATDQKENEPTVPPEVPAFLKPLVPGLEESRIGGAFKTRILKPLSDVTQDDVLDALPPSFEGGRRTTESMCLKARDMTFAQIGQLVGIDDTSDSKESRRLVAEYLKVCLDEYVERGCVAPEWGEPFTPLLDSEGEKEEKAAQTEQMKTEMNDITVGDKQKTWGEGNIVMRRPNVEDDGK